MVTTYGSRAELRTQHTFLEHRLFLVELFLATKFRWVADFLYTQSAADMYQRSNNK